MRQARLELGKTPGVKRSRTAVFSYTILIQEIYAYPNLKIRYIPIVVLTSVLKKISVLSTLGKLL